MATRRLLWALLLFHSIVRMASAQDANDASGRYTQQVLRPRQLATSPPRLRVDVVFDGPPMPPNLEASAIEEMTFIWAAYGVDVHTCNAADVRGDSAVRLAVRLADLPGRRMATGVLGSIRFLDGVPEPAIVMYPNAIAALVSTVTLYGSHDHQWPTYFRDVIVGRVLGRALAHEIGHFLLRSRHHSGSGLMRAVQPVPDLVDPDRRRFVLSADEVRRLVSITSSSPAARPSGTPSP